jgi:hypothetical protein
MRKILYAIAFLFLVVSYSYSQGRTQDVVYLKNGSVIRGLIIEQVPNKSIKVQTRDESIFVYQMDEIEKLGKEEDTSYSFKKILGPKRTYDIKGYRGFLDLGYTTGDDGCIFNDRNYYCKNTCCINVDRKDSTDIIYKEVKRS